MAIPTCPLEYTCYIALLLGETSKICNKATAYWVHRRAMVPINYELHSRGGDRVLGLETEHQREPLALGKEKTHRQQFFCKSAREGFRT